MARIGARHAAVSGDAHALAGVNSRLQARDWMYIDGNAASRPSPPICTVPATGRDRDRKGDTGDRRGYG